MCIAPSNTLIIYTDSKSIYENLVKLGTTTEKRLIVDIMCLRQSYERRLITEIKWINGELNLIDSITKVKLYTVLRHLINNNKITLDSKE